MKCFSAEENDITSKEVANLLEKAAIVETSHEPGEVISSVFVQPKKDGSHRMILNLKNLNKHVQYNHFKMDTLQSVISLKTPNCFMASVDLKDVYYSVPITVAHQKYLKFDGVVNCISYTKISIFGVCFGLSPDENLCNK